MLKFTSSFLLGILFITSLMGCMLSGKTQILFEKIPPEEVTSNQKTLFVPVGEQIQIPIVSGTPPFTYRIELGDATVDPNGNIIAPNFLTSGNIIVTDVEGKTMVMPYVVISKPQAGAAETLITSNDSLPIRVVGGKGPFSYEIKDGSGEIGEDGIFKPSGPGSVVIEVTDSIGSKSTINVSVQAPISVSQPTEVASPGANVNIADDVSGAIMPVTYEVISGEGAVSDSGVFTAPSTNGTSIIKVSDGSGNVSYKEVVVTAGASSPLRLQPPVIDVAVGKSIKLSSSGGAGGNQYQIVQNSSGAQSGQTGPGVISNSGEVVTFNAPSELSEIKYTSIRVADSNSAQETSVVTIYPKPKASIQNINITVDQSTSFTITSGKPPYAAVASRGEATLNATVVNYQAPAIEGTDSITIKDSLGQEIYVSVAINPGLQISPKKLSVKQDRYIYFVGVGGKLPYQFRMKDLNGNIVSDEAIYGSLSSEALYHSPNKNAEFVVEVQDADGAIASSRVSVYGSISIFPSFAVTTVSGELTFEVSGGVAPLQASIVEGSGAVTETSANIYKYTAPSAVSSQSTAKVKVVDASGQEVVAVIAVNPALIVSLTGVASDTLAVGNSGTLNVSGGVPPYQMTMVATDKGSFTQTSETQGSFSGLKAGSFSLSIKDALDNTISKNITVNPQLSVSPAQSTVDVLATESFIISGGVQPYNLEQPISGKPILGDGNLSFTPGASSFNYQASLGLEQAVVRVKDAIGNIFDVNVQNREVLVLAELAGIPSSPSNASSVTIDVSGFGVDEYKYVLTDNLTDCQSVGLVYSGWIASSVDISTGVLPDGNHRVCVIGRNVNGVVQIEPTAGNWVKDESPPTLAFTSPAANTWVNSATMAVFPVAGTSSEDRTVIFKIGTSTIGSLVASGGSFSGNLDLTAATQGAFTLTAELSDGAGNSSSATLLLQKDSVAPNPMSAIDDGQYLNLLNSSPAISFVAGSDPGGSGILKYQGKVVLGSDQNNSFGSWQDIATGGSLLASGLASGDQYKVLLRAVDNAGNNSAEVLSDGWIVDTLAPDAPTNLNDGTANSSLSDSPTISWTASSDSGSGIDYYEIAVGSSPTTIDKKDWTNIGNVITSTLSGMSLTDGATYYVRLRVRDRAGNISDISTSNGWIANNPFCEYYIWTSANWTAPANITLNYRVVGGGGGGNGHYSGGGGGGSSAITVAGTPQIIANGGGGGGDGQDLTGTFNITSGQALAFFVGGGGGGGGGGSTGPGGGGGAGYKGGSGGGGGYYNSGGSGGNGGSSSAGAAVCSSCGGGIGGGQVSSAGSGTDGGRGAMTFGNGGFGATSSAGGAAGGSAAGTDGGGGGSLGAGGGAGANGALGGAGGGPGKSGIASDTDKIGGLGAKAAFQAGRSGKSLPLSNAIYGSGGNAGMIKIWYMGAACSTPPTAPQNVNDTANAISWTAPANAGSVGGITYEVALGSTPGGSDLKDWTNVGNVLSWGYDGVTLNENTTYYASVRAIDGFQNLSPAAEGDGFIFVNCSMQISSSAVWVPPASTFINYTITGGGGGRYSNYSGGGGGGSSAIVVGGAAQVIANGGNGDSDGQTLTGTLTLASGASVEFITGGGGGGGGGGSTGPGGGGAAGYRGGSGGGGGYYNSGGNHGNGGTSVAGAAVCSSCGGGIGGGEVSSAGSGSSGGRGALTFGNGGYGGTASAGGAAGAVGAGSNGGGGGAYGGGGGSGADGGEAGSGGSPSMSGKSSNTNKIGGLGGREAYLNNKIGKTGPTPGANYGSGGNAGGILISYRAPSCFFTMPSAPGAFVDGPNNALTTGSMTWSAATAGSFGGTLYYEVAIGTTPGATNVKGWTVVGTGTSVPYSFFGLNTNTTYYASIRVFDSVGNQSTIVQGDGFMIVP
jgi:hypothetical protein